METAVIIAAVVTLIFVFWGLVWVSIPKDTDRRRLKAAFPRQFVRWYRSLIVRAYLLPVGWPHLVDLAFGARGNPPGPSGEVLWRHGTVTVTRIASSTDQRHREPVLVVHALLTKPWILDLTPRRSLLQMLLSQGFDVYFLDWGEPGEAEATRGLSECAEVLEQAEQAVLAHAGARRLHEVAYCLSATLLLQSLAVRPRERVGSAVVIAPLVDFAVPGGFHAVLTHRSLRPVLALDGNACVSPTIVREAFHALRPQALQALRLRWARRKDEEYREFYAAMARWAWRHRPLPGALLFDVVDLYRRNSLLPTDQPSPLTSIRTPLLVAIAERDHIVPSGSSHALTTVPKLDVTVVNVASGHVSMVVGGAAHTTFWPALASFLRDNQAEPSKQR